MTNWVYAKHHFPESYSPVIVYDSEKRKYFIAEYHALTNTWTGDGIIDNGEHIKFWHPLPKLKL